MKTTEDFYQERRDLMDAERRNMNVKLYKVGGCVRDEILGIPSKDTDFAVEAPSFQAMKEYIEAEGGKIYLAKPEYFTIRAKLKGIDADFVLCRKESGYSDGRRPDKVEVGTIYDDLARRDFTVNAIATLVADSDTNKKVSPHELQTDDFIDPHGGREDLVNRVLRCVGNPIDRFGEDSLRIMRAIRFAITKGFSMDKSVADALWNPDIVKGLANVSTDRIREELLRCFAHNTLKTISMLEYYPMVRDIVFYDNKIWLKPTSENS